MKEISLRRATIEDTEMLTDLAFKTFWDAFHAHPKNAPNDLDAYMRSAFNAEQISKELADPNAFFLVAEIENELVGYAKLVRDNIEPGITAQRPIELSRLYSRQEYLGKGVGQKLMDECFAIARNLDCDVMWLGVWEYNPRARKFYEKQGFVEVGKHIFQLGSDPQTDNLMQKSL